METWMPPFTRLLKPPCRPGEEKTERTYDAMPPGPRMDVLVGEKVFGIARSGRRYSADIACATEVMRSRAWNPKWILRESAATPGRWEVVRPLSPGAYANSASTEFETVAVGITPAHAICLAALSGAGHPTG